MSEEGRFFRRNASGVGVRGKIGFDPQGNPVFPEPFKFANNEAKGRLSAVVAIPGQGDLPLRPRQLGSEPLGLVRVCRAEARADHAHPADLPVTFRQVRLLLDQDVAHPGC